jgi:tetratricopeptide (TPR) repeat protein
MTASGTIVVATSIPPSLSRFDNGQQVGAAYQELCISSWLACGFKIISVNHREEIPALAQRFPAVQFITTERDLQHLTGRRNPYIADLLLALADRPETVAGIINSDIVLEPGPEWSASLPELTRKNVIVAQRFGTGSLRHGLLRRNTGGFDGFFFEKTFAARLAAKSLPYGMGIPWWDFWLPMAFAAEGRQVAVCEAPRIVHLDHQAGWQWALWKRYGMIFAEFLEANLPAPPPDLASVLAALRNLAPGIDCQQPNEELQNLLSELGRASVRMVRANRLSAAMQSSTPSSAAAAARSAPDPLHCSSLEDVFAHFATRVAAGGALYRGSTAAEKGDTAAADAFYRDALEKAPLDRTLMIRYGRFLLQLQDPPSMNVFVRAIGRSPSGAIIANGLGEELAARGKTERAMWCFNKAIELDATFVPAANNLAAVAGTAHRHQPALHP